MITLAYPYTPPYTQQVDLRNPDLGDPRQLNLKTSLKQNMWGEYHTYKKTPTTSKLVLVFRALTRTEIAALKSFYTKWIGQTIKYIDPLTTTWQVRFVNDSLVITTTRDSCSYEATVELITIS
jgi:hypothetical protein